MAKFIVRLVIALCRKFHVTDEVIETLIGEKRAAPYAPATMKKVVRYERFEDRRTGKEDWIPVYEREETEQETAPTVTNPEDLLTFTADRESVEDLLGYLDGASGGYTMGTFFNSPMRRLYEAMKEALTSSK